MKIPQSVSVVVNRHDARALKHALLRAGFRVALKWDYLTIYGVTRAEAERGICAAAEQCGVEPVYTVMWNKREDVKQEQRKILPCGCQPPFVLCPIAQDLFRQETAARDAYIDATRGDPTALATAREAYMAARAAYDAHVEPPTTQ